MKHLPVAPSLNFVVLYDWAIAFAIFRIVVDNWGDRLPGAQVLGTTQAVFAAFVALLGVELGRENINGLWPCWSVHFHYYLFSVLFLFGLVCVGFGLFPGDPQLKRAALGYGAFAVIGSAISMYLLNHIVWQPEPAGYVTRERYAGTESESLPPSHP